VYQALYYDHQTYTYYLRDDKFHGFQEFQYQPTYWKRVDEWNEGAQPVLTGGYAMPTKKYSKEDTNLLEKDINKELLILRELYYKFDDVVPSFHNVVYLDIEIEMGGALTPEYIKTAPMPITSIALIDMTTKTKICFIVDKSKEIQEYNQDGKHIIPCGSEKELIKRFLDKFEELDPTIIIGWNSAYFDIPYLYFRLTKIVGEDEVARMSPIRKVDFREFAGSLQVKIGGVNHLDYMLLHKKYIMKEEPSYKLGDIGTRYVDLGKIEYEGNLNTLFKNDLNAFIEYNLRDVEIIEKLEEKLKFIELTIMISHICNIPYESIYYNTVMNEGAILKYLKREGIISPNKPTTHNPILKAENTSYAGGYLLEPIPGLYFDVIDLDFTSLYPSIIKSLNLGIETLVGRIKVEDNPTYEQNHSLEKLKERDPSETIIVEKLNKTNYTLRSAKIKLGDLIKLIEQNEYTVAASGAIFRTDEKSVVATILEGWFNKREHYRGLKKTAGKAEDWANYKLYDLYQHSFKILQNAMYGTFAKNGWRYTDGHLICSAGITNSGQRLTKESIVFVNNKINTEIKEEKQNICISDTDSLYIVLGDLLKYRFPNLTPEDKNNRILELAQEIQNDANFYLNELSKRLFNIKPDTHYFQLKQEVICAGVLTTGKRRYAMYVTNKEGVPVEELDMKGLELMKSNMNKLFKKFGENFIKNVLFGKPKSEIDSDIVDFYKTLKTLDPKQLGKPTGVKQIHNYHIPAMTGDMFSSFRIKAPANTKAAIRYNDLLRFKKLDKKYESIIEGDKIFIVNLKKNPYNLETIGLPNAQVPSEIEEFVKTYIDVEEIFDSLLANKLKSLYTDLSWDFPPLNPNVNKFFTFN
jgi:DNA polymerase elongation subunit (family B)